jgi:hypothetical protein
MIRDHLHLNPGENLRGGNSESKSRRLRWVGHIAGMREKSKRIELGVEITW